MTPGKMLRFLTMTTLLGLAGFGLAEPGRLLEVTRTAYIQPADIDRVSGGRFRNNGSDMPSVPYAVTAYLIVFESTDLNGDATPITAQVFVPRMDAAEGSTFVFGPGSTGLVEACAPSRPYIESRSWDTYNAYTLAYAGQGFVSAMPNYMGFFDDVLQPYFSHVAEGRVLLDTARAVEELLEELDSSLTSNSVFVGGYSQGGHAAFAAADLASSYAPDVPLKGVVGFGATTNLETLFQEFTYVAPWVVYAYDAYFGDRINPAELLAEPYLSRLSDDAERLCILDVQSYYPSDPASLFQPAFSEALANGTLAEAYPLVYALFKENDAGLAGHGIPAIILQGVNDPVVPLESQNAFVRQLCDAGSAVRYPNYLRTRHETRYIGFEEAVAWMKARAAGEDPPSDCEFVPPD